MRAALILAALLSLTACATGLMFMPLAELRSLPPDRTDTARGDYRHVSECLVDELQGPRPIGSGWSEPLLLDWTLLTRRDLQRARVTGTWSTDTMSVPVVDFTLMQRGEHVLIEERIGRWQGTPDDPPRGHRKAAEFVRPVLDRCAAVAATATASDRPSQPTGVTPERREQTPETAALEPQQPVFRPADPNDLRRWITGRWHSTGGTNELALGPDLAWTWTSTFGGRWTGSGGGKIVDGQVVILDGAFEGTDGTGRRITPRHISIRLTREGDALAAELTTSRTYSIIFVRDGAR